MKVLLKLQCAMIAALGFVSISALAKDEVAFKIGSKVTTMDDLAKAEQGSFYEIEQKRYELIERIAKEKYIEQYFEKLAADKKDSVEKARANYLSKNVKVSQKEINEMLNKFKDHPQLKSLPKADQEKQIKEYLQDKNERDAIGKLVEKAIQKGELVIAYPRPQEPIYEIALNDDDHVRFGPNPSDTKPTGCDKDCAVTVVEYSEFQCPFCEKVIADTKKIMGEYKGKIRWAVRDFPLSFHDRAKPAAIAAHCAGEQGKFWEMYNQLFQNQRNLADADFEKHANTIKLDVAKWKTCKDKPEAVLAKIEKNFQSGVKVGVSGTPAFFINGRRLSGAIPHAEFKRVIEEEIKKAKRS